MNALIDDLQQMYGNHGHYEITPITFMLHLQHQINGPLLYSKPKEYSSLPTFLKQGLCWCYYILTITEEQVLYSLQLTKICHNNIALFLFSHPPHHLQKYFSYTTN